MTTRSITKPAAESQAAVAVIEQAAPSAPSKRARALWHADWLRARFRGVGERERWGYGVWLFAGLVFGVPESWAGVTDPPWPALSDTIGHLEELWHPIRVIVVTLIVFTVSTPSGTRSVTPASSPRALPDWPQHQGHRRHARPSVRAARSGARFISILQVPC